MAENSENIKHIRDFFDVELTLSQEEALDEIMDFLTGDRECFILKGYAGTGKTFLLKGIAEYLDHLDIESHLMTPTGRAARVAAAKTGFNANTIHKHIYQIDPDETGEKEFSAESGKVKYVFAVRENKSAGVVYLIDESSMISDEFSETETFRFGSGHLLRDLIKYCNLNVNKIIIAGDPAQLPPVSSGFSPALDITYISEKYGIHAGEYEMTHVLRQLRESDIYRNATALREKIDDYEKSRFHFTISGNDMQRVEPVNFLEKYLEVTGGEVDENTAVLAFSNRKVQYFNEMIRRELFPGNEGIVEGDRVLLVHNNYNYDIDLMNGELGEVIRLGEEIEQRLFKVKESGSFKQIPIEFLDAVLLFYDSKSRPHEIECKIINSLLQNPQRDIEMIEARALYFDMRMRNPDVRYGSPDYFTVLRTDPYYNALRVKFGYAMTCHKAQGGEWNNIFIDFSDRWLLHTKEGLRWHYTALTRSAGRAFAVGMRDKDMKEDIEIITDDTVDEDEISVKTYENAEIFEFENDLQKTLFLRISSRLTGLLEIISILHFPFCERYFFKFNSDSYFLNIWYSENEKITLIDFQPGMSPEIKNDILALLADMTGKRIFQEL